MTAMIPTTVLFMHSGGFSPRQWRKLGEQLAPRHRVLSPELIGYGATRWPNGKPFHFREDVARLVELLDGGAAHLVGHSYGGLLALQLALAHPELVRLIAAYEPVAFGVLDEPADAPALEALPRLPAYQADANGVDEHWLTVFVDWWNGAGAWSRLGNDTKQAFRDVSWKVAQEVASLVADTTDHVRYATIAVPTLVMGGERTQPPELRVIEKLARVLPRASLRVFPELGHMGPITHAPLVNAAIAAFIEANDG